MKEDTCCGRELEFKELAVPHWADYQLYRAECEECGTRYDRRDGSKVLYAQDESGDFYCRECGTQIMTVPVVHSIHLKGMRMAGFGNTKRERVPYCPECEEKPNETGSSIKMLRR